MFENLFQKYISVKNIIFFIIAILFLVFITKIKDIAILFFASYVISCSLNPLVDKLSNRLNRSVASAIVLLSTISLLGLFFIPLIAMAGHEIKSFISNIPVYIDSLKDFISAIEEGRRPLVDLYEGKKTVEIILGAYESAKSGKKVML